MVARLLPERGWSFTSLGFFLCLLSILYTVLCDICIVWAMCDTVAPLLSSQWLAIAGWWYFSPWWSKTDRSQKVDFWGGQSCVGFNSIVQRPYGQSHSFLPGMLPGIFTSYILTIFQEATQCLTLWKISLENFCKNFFPGVYKLTSNFVIAIS